MPLNKALIVDDEPDIRELLQLTLERMDIQCETAGDLNQARSLLQHQSFNLCLTDMRLPDGEGIDLVKLIQERYSELPVAVITAHGNTQMAIDCLKAGAFDFISKPVQLDMLRNLANSAISLESKNGSQPYTQEALLGKSEAMQKIHALIHRIARSQAPVCIYGESGTGKELVAREIHAQGSRKNKPFIAINCGAIPPDLMESEFFGHMKGCFTGAINDKEGLFQAADGGTLFLDEVSELPTNMQVKLLRAIQEKTIKPIGHSTEIPIDTRILSASNKNLAPEVEKGAFRHCKPPCFSSRLN